MAPLYGSWEDLFKSRDHDILLVVFTPFVESLLANSCHILKTFLDSMERLHTTALKGTSTKLFDTPSDKQLLREYQKCPSEDTLSQIYDATIEKALHLWKDTYSTSIYQPLIVYLSAIYDNFSSNFIDFPRTFPLSTMPANPVDKFQLAKKTKPVASKTKVCEIVSFPLQKKKKTSPLAVLTPF
jgi:hypothetical protein